MYLETAFPSRSDPVSDCLCALQGRVWGRSCQRQNKRWPRRQRLLRAARVWTSSNTSNNSSSTCTMGSHSPPELSLHSPQQRQQLVWLTDYPSDIARTVPLAQPVSQSASHCVLLSRPASAIPNPSQPCPAQPLAASVANHITSRSQSALQAIGQSHRSASQANNRPQCAKTYNSSDR